VDTLGDDGGGSARRAKGVRDQRYCTFRTSASSSSSSSPCCTRISSISFETVAARRRLRRYVQIQGSERVYFKSFGDPRVMSRSTGCVFPDTASLRAAQAGDGPATEMLHFAIHSPRSPYGVPRWVGTLLSVLGSRQMEEVTCLLE
jgi:hypothetical protein